jgi:adenosylcobinamide-phosphate synthase
MRIAPDRLAAAYLLDCIAGDPRWLPHPVRLIGGAISLGERMLLRQGSPDAEMLRGVLLTGAVVSGSWLTARVAVCACGVGGEILLAWTALATRSLLVEAGAVLEALDHGDLRLARMRLATIVGRDTDQLEEPEILRAVIETAAEGLGDGIVAPLFYLAWGGVPLALAYKAVNTLDSMIGHIEPPYRHFGWAAARLDDVANFVPARLAALAIIACAVCSGGSRRAWQIFLRDRHKHASPNAGQTEAAMAGALGVRLGGLNYYGGQASPKPSLGAEGRSPSRGDARAALRIVTLGSVAAFTAAWIWLWRNRRRQ